MNLQTCAAITFFASCCLVPSVMAAEPETLSYGSKPGMEVTVVSKSGINTSKAVIKIQLTRKNAADLCLRQLNQSSPECIEEVLHTHGSQLRTVILANCEDGTWTDMYGLKYELLGENTTSDQPQFPSTGFLIIDKQALPVKFLDGSPQSGYAVELGVFRLLCPSSTQINNPRVMNDSKGDLQSTRKIAEGGDDGVMRLSPGGKVPLDASVAGIRSDEGDDELEGEGTVSRVPPNRRKIPLEPNDISDDEELATMSEDVSASSVKPKAVAKNGDDSETLSDAEGVDHEEPGSMSEEASVAPAKSNVVSAEDVIMNEDVPGRSTQSSSTAAMTGDVSLEQRVSALESKLSDALSTSPSDRVLCKTALSSSGLQWETSPEFRASVAEALRRNLTVDRCRVVLGLANPSSSTPRN